MAVMDALAEDDGPVVLGRRRSRHGNYYEEIPPEPEPEPVPEVPEHVPEPLLQTEPSVSKWDEQQSALAYINGLGLANWTTTTTAVFTSPPTTTTAAFNWNDGYSISLNDVIGSYKPAPLEYTYLAGPPGLIDMATKECGHQHTESIGPGKFKFNKGRSGGSGVEPVRCVNCGLKFSKERKF